MIKDVPPALHLSEEQLSPTRCKPDQKCSNLSSTLQTDVTAYFFSFYKYIFENFIAAVYSLRRLLKKNEIFCYVYFKVHSDNIKMSLNQQNSFFPFGHLL